MAGSVKVFFVLGALFLVSLTGCDNSNNNNQSGTKHADSGSYAYTEDGIEVDDNLYQPVIRGGYDPSPKKSPNFPVVRSAQQRYSALINREARKKGMDPFFVHAIISQESRYLPDVTSKAGAGGIMQIMPLTASELGITTAQRYTPEVAVPAGIRYLKRMMGWSKGNIQAMATGYNSGPARGKALFQRDTTSRYWSRNGEQPSTSNGVPSPKFHGGETYNYARYVAWFYELYRANPHLVGLADASPGASECYDRGLC